jgi:hypothetical protein
MPLTTASIFPTYAQGENRVTFAILAVLERISLQLLSGILAAAAEDSTLSLVAFQSQPPLVTGKRRPDASISASFNYLFEVKRVAGQINEPEVTKLRDYLAELDATDGDGRLFVLTPDAQRPPALEGLTDTRLTWIDFRSLSAAFDQVIEEDAEGIADRDRFLLRELQALFESDDLLGGADVVVVAARHAYPEYKRRHAYICQPATTRTFQPGIERMGFYADGEIKPEVPMILDHRGEVLFDPQHIQELRERGEPWDLEIANAIEASLNDPATRRTAGLVYQVFLLASPDDPATRLFEVPIKNTTRAASGRPWAWTLGQRYTRSDVLRRGPATTTELEQLEA